MLSQMAPAMVKIGPSARRTGEPARGRFGVIAASKKNGAEELRANPSAPEKS
jgi:hypothetical protein